MCGLVYQNPRPAADEIGAYYPAEYESFIRPPWKQPNPLARWVQMYGYRKRWKLVERWAPRRDGRRSILDIGCATGVFLATGPQSWQKVGIEPNEVAARFARGELGLDVHQGRFEEVDLPVASFDIITLWDVLEHMCDPRETLRQARELLRPDGILVLKAPNLGSWDAQIFGRYWAGLDQPRHMFVPDAATLHRLLTTTGFVEVERQCMSGTYSMLVLSYRFWLRERIADERRRRLAQRILDNFGTRLLLAPCLWMVDKVAQKGSSLTVVARSAAAQ